MPILSRLQDLLDRLVSYPVGEVLFELLVIGVVVYLIIRFVQGTRAAGALKGLLLILVIGTILVRVIGGETFQRLTFLYDRFLALVAIALIVIFQPELRRALIRLGETSFFRAQASEISVQIESITTACAYLSKARFGAIIVIERQLGLRGLTEGGTALNADLSARLLQTIFFPGSALHDLAVVIKGRRVFAAGVQLPLAEPEDMPDPTLGSRHRAAVGLTKESDALVVVVSEESGQIRIADRGRLSRPLSAEDLEIELRRRLGRPSPPGPTPRPPAADDEELGAGQEPMDAPAGTRK